MTNKLSGYVYILEVSDIYLPVCKIGMTTRDPISRCQEINKSSTGDFIWSVAYFIAVDDCKKFEKLIHNKLNPLRQKRREFFNLYADDAYKAVISIFESQEDVKITDELNSKDSSIIKSNRKVKKNFLSRSDSVEYADMLQSFCDVLGVKGRAFGQLNKPFFGMSDGNEGVQWNISVNTKTKNVHIGVNLEGKIYKNWPISQLIKSELSAPRLLSVIEELETSDDIYLTFWRDAWQVASRPEIKEKYIGGRSFILNELNSDKWNCILSEAQECLDKESGYLRRSIQDVTIVKKDGSNIVRAMQVSPHLTIWSPLIIKDNAQDSIRKKINQLTSIHFWMMSLS
ncbi:GIY-YIG nuclease family protein [Klebsiella sp. K4-172]|uniref:GIY-YIG nuclease family protein n=1 Tax=Klebsiella sp. K4-172 TaxID=2920185 RepID=UPI0024DE8303|nr:GIY-YIG nuclease family protein [Klebsiella sp. K4-172]MDK1895499.1 GIY-YIG nuclease family protein [Klebsiella sp. K4-172]